MKFSVYNAKVKGYKTVNSKSYSEFVGKMVISLNPHVFCNFKKVLEIWTFNFRFLSKHIL